MSTHKWKRILSAVIIAALFPWSASSETLLLPSKLEVISAQAFEGDMSLDEVVLPEGIREIGPRAFANSSVTDINLPVSLETIADDAFDGAENVVFHTVEDSDEAQWVRDHFLFVTAEAIYTDTYNLSWEANAPAEEYTVYTYTDEKCENLYRVEQAEEAWGTFFVGDMATQYWFVVEHGELRSRPVTAEPLDVLPAPENLQAEITEDGYIQLTWDPVENATGYRIYYSEEEEWIPETEWFGFEGEPGNSDVWIDWGQSLHLWVCADNGNGPNARTGITVTRESDDPAHLTVETIWTDCYLLNWNPVDDMGSYHVYCYSDAACTELYDEQFVEDCYLFLTTDVGYRYWFVLEYEMNGEIIRTGAVSSMPIKPEPAPRNLDAIVDEYGNVSLIWDAVENATGYRIYWSNEDTWNRDTEWDAFEGEPGYNWLSVGEGETLYIWVCADNGIGPNERAFTVAMRDADVITYVQEQELTLLSLKLEDPGYPVFSTDGITDRRTIAWISDYNSQVMSAREIRTAYNSMVQDLYDTSYDFVIEAGFDPENGPANNIISVSDDAINLLTNDTELMDYEVLDDGTIAFSTASGETVYVDNLSISLTHESGNGSSAWDNAGPSDDTLNALTNAISEFFSTEESSARTDLENIRKQYAEIEKTLDLYKQETLLNTVPENEWRQAKAACTRADADITVGVIVFDAIGALIPVIGLPSNIDNLVKDRAMLAVLDTILEHGHPTSFESTHRESRELGYETEQEARDARFLLPVDQWINRISVATAEAVLIASPKGFATGVGLAIASRCIRTKAKNHYEKAIANDRMLHYELYGCVRDEDTHEDLDGVTVTVTTLNEKHDEMEVTTDNQGAYRMEPLSDNVKIRFTKDGYKPEEREYSLISFMQVNCDIDMKPAEKLGRITGYVFDSADQTRLSGVKISCEAGTVYTSDSGSFSMVVPVGYYNLFYQKTGYIDGSNYVVVNENQASDASIELDKNQSLDLYGSIEGKVTDEDGNAVVSARVSIDGSVTYTAEDGSYRFDSVTVGTHDISIGGKEAYITIHDMVQVNENQTAKYNATMQWHNVIMVRISGVAHGMGSFVVSDGYSSYYPKITDSEGNPMLRNIPTGTYGLTIRASEAIRPDYLELQSGKKNRDFTYYSIYPFSVSDGTHETLEAEFLDITDKYLIAFEPYVSIKDRSLIQSPQNIIMINSVGNQTINCSFEYENGFSTVDHLFYILSDNPIGTIYTTVYVDGNMVSGKLDFDLSKETRRSMQTVHFYDLGRCRVGVLGE